jgi:tryptophanyl-tRNA synthetase
MAAAMTAAAALRGRGTAQLKHALSSSTSTSRVLSGIQPTGVPHLGNFCGAISKWVDLQDGFDLQEDTTTLQSRLSRLYAVVDQHAITVPYDPATMPSQVRSLVAALLASGLDPKRNVLFKQSDVRYHTELAWYLGCITPIGWLNRMTQYKQKEQAQKMESGLGLLAYPVLMAADILVYKATHVPVGDDQIQHLELARDIAATFNSRFQRDVMVKPMAVESDHQQSLYRIMNLREPTTKMSKSDPSPKSRIDLTDTGSQVRKKIMGATTDSLDGIWYDKSERPGISNLLSIFSAVTDQSVDALVAQYGNYRTGEFKREVASAVVAK